MTLNPLIETTGEGLEAEPFTYASTSAATIHISTAHYSEGARAQFVMFSAQSHTKERFDLLPI